MEQDQPDKCTGRRSANKALCWDSGIRLVLPNQRAGSMDAKITRLPAPLPPLQPRSSCLTMSLSCTSTSAT